MYLRKVKKAGKVYSYYYKSKRVGNKVKSIYVGRALEEDIKKPVKEIFKDGIKKENKIKVESLLEFDFLLNEINELIINKDLNNALYTYNKMFEIYSKIDINPEDKLVIFGKLDKIYQDLVNLSKENKISLDKD